MLRQTLACARLAKRHFSCSVGLDWFLKRCSCVHVWSSFERGCTSIARHSLIHQQTVCKCLIQQTKLHLLSSLPATRPSAVQPRLAFVEFGSAGKIRMLRTMYSLSALVNMLFVSACSRPRCAAELCFEHGWRVTCLQCAYTMPG